jgi:hypothetical protein
MHRRINDLLAYKLYKKETKTKNSTKKRRRFYKAI